MTAGGPRAVLDANDGSGARGMRLVEMHWSSNATKSIRPSLLKSERRPPGNPPPRQIGSSRTVTLNQSFASVLVPGNATKSML